MSALAVIKRLVVVDDRAVEESAKVLIIVFDFNVLVVLVGLHDKHAVWDSIQDEPHLFFVDFVLLLGAQKVLLVS